MILSALPSHIIKISKYWFKDTKTGKRIHADRISNHLPKPILHEEIINKRWDLKY